MANVICGQIFGKKCVKFSTSTHSLMNNNDISAIFHHQIYGEESKIVKHLQFTDWRDMKVPEFVDPILDFLHTVRNESNQQKGPTIVHCRYEGLFNRYTV